MACAQYVDWIPSGFSDEINNAFILQEIYLEKEIDGETTAVHYYESWHVSDGICEKEPGQDSDDLFCIGHPLDDSDALKESIGHRGKVTFTPRVFLVKEADPLYSDIKSWPTDVVKEANGLRACYYTEEMELLRAEQEMRIREMEDEKYELVNAFSPVCAGGTYADGVCRCQGAVTGGDSGRGVPAGSGGKSGTACYSENRLRRQIAESLAIAQECDREMTRFKALIEACGAR